MSYPTPQEMIDRLFVHHPSFGDQVERYMKIHEAGHVFASTLASLTPNGPDKTLLIRRAHEAVMLAIASIACNETPPAGEDEQA